MFTIAGRWTLAGKEAMSLSDYRSSFIDAGITGRSEQERYGRFIDFAVAQRGVKVDEIMGVGAVSGDLYVMTGQAVICVHEAGMFKKRIEIKQTTPITAIATLDSMANPPSDASIKFQGRHWTEFSITGRDSAGQVALQITWGWDDEDSNKRARDRLFALIGKAIHN